MLNALIALISVVVDILVTALKKLLVGAVLATLFIMAVIVTLVIILDHSVG